MNTTVLDAARRWAEQDPDPETRAEVNTLLKAVDEGDTAAIAQLHDRFDTRLVFGTAGLRGRLGGGPNRMNRVLVAQAAAGIMAHLTQTAHLARPVVIIGYDGRKNSDIFARDTAELVAGAGGKPVLMPRMLPTPVLAFAVRHLRADAGIMVTASHNPPDDNGYKIYLGGVDGGSQIIPPDDAKIAAHILHIAQEDIRDLPRSSTYQIADESLIDSYIEHTAAVRNLVPASDPAASGPSELRVVYTAMHGVGWETAQRAFASAGLPAPIVVREQIDPDPTFHTVAFPNPEEPGALDLAFKAARDAHADIIIANDPDADRLAVAIPDPATDARYRRLSGNELGLLLGWTIAQAVDKTRRTGTLVASVVSSPGLRQIAEAHHLEYAETLTGFKWISRADNLLFGFEEALGYLVNPDDIRDKDGISAAVLILTLAANLHRHGQTIADRLDSLATRFGAHASAQVSMRVSDTDQITQTMARLRDNPPTQLGQTTVTHIDDLLRESTHGLPASDVLRIHMADGSRVMIRPSGTEPKLKIYIDTAATAGTPAQRRSDAQARATQLAEATRLLLGVRGALRPTSSISR